MIIDYDDGKIDKEEEDDDDNEDVLKLKMVMIKLDHKRLANLEDHENSQANLKHPSAKIGPKFAKIVAVLYFLSIN